MFFAAIVSGCSVVLGRPEQGIEVRERVRVCFYQSEGTHITAVIEPADCYSIRCTRINQKNGTAVLDRKWHRLEFETTFVLSEIRPFLGDCISDCAGRGQMIFDLGHLKPGTYDVYIWGDLTGELSLASDLSRKDQCLAQSNSD